MTENGNRVIDTEKKKKKKNDFVYSVKEEKEQNEIQSNLKDLIKSQMLSSFKNVNPGKHMRVHSYMFCDAVSVDCDQ